MPTLTRSKITTATVVKKTKQKTMLAPGHRACAGCGQLIAARTVANVLGANTIIANATGCLEVTTTPYPESSWGMPWIHSLFENATAVATGISAALRQQKKDKKVKVVVQGGDGSTFDIGIGLISGMWERGEDILYICYDTEAYSNTGMQASGATPLGSSTTTAPAGMASTGSLIPKKDMLAIALAHNVPYVAQCTAGYLGDIETKVKKALETPGPGYIQILTPCIPGWGIKSSDAVKLGKVAAQTGLYPLLEFVNGELTKKMNISNKIKVDEYLKEQGRFAHLFKSDEGKKTIKTIQAMADKNIAKYGL
jgi:pyruvate ferredoxin oxidoreductase beta subunit